MASLHISCISSRPIHFDRCVFTSVCYCRIVTSLVCQGIYRSPIIVVKDPSSGQGTCIGCILKLITNNI